MLRYICFFLLYFNVILCWHLLKQKLVVSVAAEPKEMKVVEKEAPAKTKPPAKAPVKALPELMEEDVIPSLKAILEAQADVSDIELSFQDDRVSFSDLNSCSLINSWSLSSLNLDSKWQLDGSFLKNGVPYSFWAFFPNGLTGTQILRQCISFVIVISSQLQCWLSSIKYKKNV